jgi:hypothetical protein
MHIEKSAIKIIVDEIIAENPTICRMADNSAISGAAASGCDDGRNAF